MKKLLLSFLPGLLFISPVAGAPAPAARTAAREKAAALFLQKAEESKKPAEIASALFKAAGEFKELKRFDEAVFHLLKIPRVKGVPRHESTCAFRAAGSGAPSAERMKRRPGRADSRSFLIFFSLV